MGAVRELGAAVDRGLTGLDRIDPRLGCVFVRGVGRPVAVWVVAQVARPRGQAARRAAGRALLKQSSARGCGRARSHGRNRQCARNRTS